MNRIIYALNSEGNAVLPMLETPFSKPVTTNLRIVDRETWLAAFASGRRIVQDDELVQKVLTRGPEAFFERFDESGNSLGGLNSIGIEVEF